jgi:hypothetical protein
MPNSTITRWPSLTVADVRAIPLPQGRYFGPCANRDVVIAFDLFGDRCTEFMFCDRGYRPDRSYSCYTHQLPQGWARTERWAARTLPGLWRRTWYDGYRPFLATTQIDRLRRPDGTLVRGEFRCDLAQRVLRTDFRFKSISCFLHVKDSGGEGGSALWFLGSMETHASRRRSNPDAFDRADFLLPELARRLADGALVVTDGSLADCAFGYPEPFFRCGVKWEPLGAIVEPGHRYGYGGTWIWRVNRPKGGAG